MSDEKEPKSGLLTPNLLNVLLLAVAGTLFVSQDSYHESRPERPPITMHGADALENVNVRMWQDPFEPIERQKAGEQTRANTGAVAKPPSDEELSPDQCDDTYSHCLKDVKRILKKNSSETNSDPEQAYTLVALMLPGGQYFEDSEIRRRLRYAVLSGFFAALDYTPTDAEHIGYFHHHQDKPIDSKIDSKVAFEWLMWKPQPVNAVYGKGEKHPPILLLYLNTNDFSGKPYAKLQNLFRKFPLFLKGRWDVKVLGPINSDHLQEIAREVNEFHPQPVNRSPTPPDADLQIKLYSPRATVDENKLLNYHYPPPLEHPEKPAETDLVSYFNQHIGTGFFTRTIASDTTLAQTLAKELMLRGLTADEHLQLGDAEKIPPPLAPGQHVVLISEQDSLYAWHINETFAEEITRHFLGCDTAPEKFNDHCTEEYQKGYAKMYMHPYRYFRGLDGEQSRKTPGAARQETGGGQETPAVAEALEDANGDSQFDYIRRLLERLEKLRLKLESEHGDIAAIGVLGGDVYDKLLVLEAIQDTFPQAIIFTNELDARLLHPDQNKWARNLIVASRFGLELTEGLQQQIPPFRDSVQTAYFWTTQMLLAGTQATLSPEAGCLSQYKDNPETINQFYVGHPVLHEIGRTKLFHLHEAKDSQQQQHGAPKQECYRSHQKPLLSTGKYQAFKYLAFLVLGAIGVSFARQFFFQQLRAARHFVIKTRIVNLQRRWTLSLLLFGLAAGEALRLAYPDLDEPFAWLEGVSMWPSEIIKYCAVILAVYFMLEVFKLDELMTELCQKHFRLGLAAEPRTSGEKFIKVLLAEIKSSQLSNWGYFAGLGLVIALLIFNFGYSNAPYRGDVIYNIYNLDLGLTLLLTAGSIWLLIWVANAVQALTGCLRTAIQNEQSLAWPLSVCQRYQESMHIDAEKLHDWVTIRLIGELTERVSAQIFYPFAVAALMMLSRLSYFDNWVMQPGLLAVFCLVFAYLFYCDYRLKAVVDEVEKQAVKRLRHQVISQLAVRADHDSAGQLEKLLDVAREYAVGAYKPFLQRPIFQGCVLIILSIALSYSDYSSLMWTLLK
jgi:hypothetical protein